ncbi:MAG: hypothetical protein JRE14_07305, partial [Deltaproteobacteria bacterium]|nr:hypothetical protein [Deltaproteobacteria bacterium]
MKNNKIFRERHYHLLGMVKDNWGKMITAIMCLLAMAATEAGIPFLM